MAIKKHGRGADKLWHRQSGFPRAATFGVCAVTMVCLVGLHASRNLVKPVDTLGGTKLGPMSTTTPGPASTATPPTTEVTRAVFSGQHMRFPADATRGPCLSDRLSLPARSSGPTDPIPDLDLNRAKPRSVPVYSSPDLKGIITNGEHYKTASTQPEGYRRCIAQAVPKLIHFLWVGKAIPERNQAVIKETVRIQTGWKVVLWTEDCSDAVTSSLGAGVECRDLANYWANFRNGDIVQGKVANLGFKTDFLRLEVVYLEGGVYMDTDSHSVLPMDDFGDLFRWPFVSHVFPAHKNVCNCIFAFKKGSGFLDYFMDIARENCLRRNNCNSLTSAGPPAMTGAVMRYNDPEISFIPQKFTTSQSVGKTGKGIFYASFDASWMDR